MLFAILMIAHLCVTIIIYNALNIQFMTKKNQGLLSGTNVLKKNFFFGEVKKTKKMRDPGATAPGLRGQRNW